MVNWALKILIVHVFNFHNSGPSVLYIICDPLASYNQPGGISIVVAAIKILAALRHPVPHHLLPEASAPFLGTMLNSSPSNDQRSSDPRSTALHQRAHKQLGIALFYWDCHHTQQRRFIVWVSAALIKILLFPRLEETRARTRCGLKTSHPPALA